MKKILISLLVLGLIGAAVGFYLWNKPHENMASAKADINVDAVALFSEFSTSEEAANGKYLDKTIAVTGTVKDFSKGADGSIKVSLNAGADAMFGISCTLDPLTKHARDQFSPGEKVTFKGKCSGFNMDVQLDRCVEVK